MEIEAPGSFQRLKRSLEPLHHRAERLHIRLSRPLVRRCGFVLTGPFVQEQCVSAVFRDTAW
jgi:hypothetical protein